MPRSNFRPEIQKVLAALNEERELTQTQHFELRKLIAGGQKDKAITLLNELFEREADVLKVLSRLKYLEVEAASELLNKNEDKTK